jgi:hypothetical protein
MRAHDAVKKKGPWCDKKRRAHDAVKAAHDALRVPPLMLLLFMFLLILFHIFVVNLNFSDYVGFLLSDNFYFLQSAEGIQSITNLCNIKLYPHS